jgi:hypothetical protein
MLWAVVAAADVAVSSCYTYADPRERAEQRIPPQAAPNDVLGDVWEMEEVACWRGTWLRRGTSALFDGYWFHPDGERIRASLQAWVSGRNVTLVRRHSGGKYCRYDGLISSDWHFVEGHYTCTWARTPMRWTAEIIRLQERLPALLQDGLPLPPQ